MKKISVEYALAVKDKLIEIKEKEGLILYMEKVKEKVAFKNILKQLVIL